MLQYSQSFRRKKKMNLGVCMYLESRENNYYFYRAVGVGVGLKPTHFFPRDLRFSAPDLI
jgi:hypothetical protein